MPRLAAILLATLTLAACSTRSPEVPAYAPMVAPPEPASIVGQGAYRHEGGARVTCAGYSVALMLASPAYVQRVEALYGPPAPRVMAPASQVKARSTKLPPSPQPVATSTCDANGAFGFPGVPAGGYFLIAHVKQKGTTSHADDYVILERVFLKSGETAEISLAP